MSALTWKTYDDWRVAGFQVQRGEKGSPSKRKDGKKLFSSRQVKPMSRGMGNYESAEEYDFLSSEEMDFVDSEYFREMGDR